MTKKLILIFLIMSLLLIILITYPVIMNAENCNEKIITPDIHVNLNPLKIDREKNVSYLRSPAMSDGHNPIGMYMGNKEIKIAPTYTLNKRFFSSGMCAQLTSVKINIEINPVIYISTEAQQYACTKQRVYDHEMTHYDIDMKAVDKVSDYLKKQVRENYTSALIVSNETAINNIMDKLNNQIIKSGFEYIKSESSPFHARLDTPENYKKESTYCSEIENVALTGLIMGIK